MEHVLNITLFSLFFFFLQIGINLKLWNRAYASAEDALLVSFAIYSEFAGSSYCFCGLQCVYMWHDALQKCVRRDSKGMKWRVHVTPCVFFFPITLVCSFPDVRMDTSALDAYRLSHCGCTCPSLSKVCSNDMSSWEQRHSCHWITSVDSCCPPTPTPPTPTATRSLPLFSPPFLLLRSTRIELCTAPCARWCHPRDRSASAVCRCSVVLILCLSAPPLPLSLPSFSLFSYAYSPFHSTLALSLPLFSSFLSLVHNPSPPSLSLALFLSIRCPNDFTGDRCQTYVMASFYRMSISSSATVGLSLCHACMLGVETALISCHYLIVLSVSALVTHSQAGID